MSQINTLAKSEQIGVSTFVAYRQSHHGEAKLKEIKNLSLCAILETLQTVVYWDALAKSADPEFAHLKETFHVEHPLQLAHKGVDSQLAYDYQAYLVGSSKLSNVPEQYRARFCEDAGLPAYTTPRKIAA